MFENKGNGKGALGWFFNRGTVSEAKKPTDVTTNFSKDQIRGMANVLGFSVDDLDIKEVNQELTRLLKAGGVQNDKNDGNFVDFWDENGFVKTPNRALEGMRISRYEQYAFMVANCLSPDTKIALLDGTSVAIKDLVGRKEFYVYAYDVETKKIVAAKATNARITKLADKMIKITLDSGEILECTPEHPILMRNGEYKEAQKIKPTESIMPLYRKLDDKGYEEIHHPDGEWEHTHRLSDEYNLAVNIYSVKGGKRVRHQSFEKLEEEMMVFNHKVVSIEVIELETPIEVYDIEVPGYHNFALDNGIFVHNSVEVGMAIRTYIDEVLSSINDEDQFFNIEVRDIKTDRVDTKASKFINNLMKMSGVYDNIRKRVSQLAMYGDSAERIEKILSGAKDPRAVEGWQVETYTISKPCMFERVNLPNKDVAFKFIEKKAKSYGSCNGSAGTGKKEDIAPWDMIHFRLSTSREDLEPYGEALIEIVRSSYKRLLIIESLLALTRSSRVERIIMKIPTNTDNPDLMVTKLMRYKNLAKNMIFGTGSQMTTDKKPLGFTDILYLPKGKDKQSSWEMDRIQGNSVDLGTIEDVEYFQDKITNGLNLPRGYLKNDDAYMGYRKLALQDLRLSRTINTIFRALAEGYALMSKILLFRTDKWKDDYHIIVSYSPPAPVASEQLSAMRDSLDVITQIVELTSAPDPETGEITKDPKVIRSLLLKLANFPRRLVDSVLPVGRVAKVTTEELKQRLAIAFMSFGEERVTSDSIKFVNKDKAGRRKPENITEGMLV